MRQYTDDLLLLIILSLKVSVVYSFRKHSVEVKSLEPIVCTQSSSRYKIAILQTNLLWSKFKIKCIVYSLIP